MMRFYSVNANERKEGFPFSRMMQVFIITCLMITATFSLSAQVPAFPGAEGFGAVATGGRGGKVIYVTNLNDSGSGSLREAIEATGTRTVVFKVSGTIALQSRLDIKNGGITIAGQTAPGDGICVKGNTFTVSANNVIIRYIRARLGDETLVQDDAMNGRNRSNIIIDHCSMSWSVDECGSFYDNSNFTMQYCILSESLYHSVHDKGNHGYGGIWGGKGATFHHNLLAHHTSRNPRFCGSRYSNLPSQEVIDHRNNVIYNWGGNSCYGAEGGSYNIVNNYYKYGPATSSGVKDRIINPNADDGSNSQPAGVWGNFYIDGNYVWKYSTTTNDNWRGVDGPDDAQKEEIKLTEPVSVAAVTTQSAQEAFEHVIAKAGAVLPKRDPLDTRIIQETVTGTAHYGGVYGDAKGIIDTQGTVGGWPTLNSTTAPADTDSDGMPDEWEDANGLDKNNPNDRNDDMNGEGYTNLEYYLNSLVEAFEYILRPINLEVDTIIDKEVTLKWVDISDNETGFLIERKDGDTWNKIHTTAADQTTYTDDGIPAYGIFYYRIRSVNANMESFVTDSVRVRVLDHTGINRVDYDKHNLQVYPNPFRNVALITYELDEVSDVSVSLIDMTGREIIMLTEETQYPGSYNYNLDASGLGNGVYFVRMISNGTLSLYKVILAR